MNWFAWRQHRRQILILTVLLAIYAAIVIPTGMRFWHSYQQELANCARNPNIPSCSDISDSLFQTTADKLLIGLIPTTVLFLPIILGVFWGVPLLAREYSEGTNSLAWTQSVSRRKWLTIKLIWMLAATAIFIGVFAALNTWWSNTSNALNMDRFSNGNMFGVQGLVPVAVGLFCVSFGILFGAWFRKIMVGVGVTLAAFVIASHIIIPNLIRPYYMKPISVTAPIGPRQLNDNGNIPQNAWIISQTIFNGSGQAIRGDIYPYMPPQCQKLTQNIQVSPGSPAGKAKAAGIDPVNDCLNRAGWHQVARYQPSYRYWDFQEIESGIYLVLTAIAVAATYWLVLKRDA